MGNRFIFLPPFGCLSDVVTREGSQSGCWFTPCLVVGYETCRQIRTLSGGLDRVILRMNEVDDPRPARKTSK